MSKYGYARVSSIDQSLGVQEEQLRAVGCDVVRSEQASGASRVGRSELALLLQFLRSGDTLAVTRIDRLARSLGDLQDLLKELKLRGVSLEVTEQRIDNGTSAGKAFLDILGVFAEFENNLRRERQTEGISRAKARGAYTGSKHCLPVAEIRRLKAEGIGATEISRRLGIGRASVYRLLEPPGPNRTVKVAPGESGCINVQ